MTEKTESGRPDLGGVATEWWQRLQGDAVWGGRGAVARIRRTRSVAELACEPAVLHLVRRLPLSNPGRVAVVAGVLAWVRENRSNASAASAIGRSDLSKSDALVSESRFRRLLRADGNAELLGSMRRIVRHAGGSLNVGDLARSLLYWNDRTRERWSYDYYKVGPGDPGRTQPGKTGQTAA